MRTELKKMFHSIELKLALIVGFLLFMFETVIMQIDLNRQSRVFGESGSRYYSAEPDISCMQLWIGQDWYTGFGDLFYLILFPLIAALPYAVSHYREKKLGYDKIIMSQIGRKRYFINKYIVTFLSGALVIVIPPLLSILWSMYKYPVKPMLSIGATTVVNGALWSEIYYSKPLVYVLLFGIMNAVVGGSLAVLALSLTHYVESGFQLLIVPMLLNILLPLLLNYLKNNVVFLIPYAYVDPMPMGEVKIQYIVISVILINIISIILYFTKTRRDIL